MARINDEEKPSLSLPPSLVDADPRVRIKILRLPSVEWDNNTGTSTPRQMTNDFQSGMGSVYLVLYAVLAYNVAYSFLPNAPKQTSACHTDPAWKKAINQACACHAGGVSVLEM